jgi:hypothetical protein
LIRSRAHTKGKVTESRVGAPQGADVSHSKNRATPLHNVPMRPFVLLFLLVAVSASAVTADEKEAIAIVQKVFDGIAAHDGAMIRANMLTDARVYAARDAAAPAVSTVTETVDRLTGLKEELLERFTSAPQVSVRGRIAEVWGEYEFIQGGKFHHCGVDSATLLKTVEGWKISALVFTAETTGCRGH